MQMVFSSVIVRHHFHHLGEVSTYNFSGDAITILGFVGVISAGIIVYTAFSRYWNSPLRK